MACGAPVRRAASRPAPSVARFQNVDVDTLSLLPETAGSAVVGGTPAATEPRSPPRAPNTEIFITLNEFRHRLLAQRRPGKFPLYPQHYLFVPACRADCRLCPINCQAGKTDRIERNE